MRLDISLQPKNNKRRGLVALVISSAAEDWINKNVASIKRIDNIESAMHNYIASSDFACIQPYRYYPIQKNELLDFINYYRNDTISYEGPCLQPEEISDRIAPDPYGEIRYTWQRVIDRKNHIKILTETISTIDWNEDIILISQGIVFY